MLGVVFRVNLKVHFEIISILLLLTVKFNKDKLKNDYIRIILEVTVVKSLCVSQMAEISRKDFSVNRVL